MELYCAELNNKTLSNNRTAYLSTRKSYNDYAYYGSIVGAFVNTKEKVEKKIKKLSGSGHLTDYDITVRPLTAEEAEALRKEIEFKDRLSRRSSVRVFSWKGEPYVILGFKKNMNKADRELMGALNAAGIYVYKGKDGNTYARVTK